MTIPKFRAYNIIVNRFQFFTLPDLEKQDGAIQWHILNIDQYIGAKDRKGKEIYNNDIYQRFNYIHRVIWSEKEMGWRGVCIGREKDFGEGYETVGNYLFRENNESLRHFVIDCKDGITEVIGNAHQNKELLKLEI